MQYSCIVGPSFLRPGRDLVEELHMYRTSAGAAEDDGLQCDEQAESRRSGYEPGRCDFGQALYQGSPAGEFGRTDGDLR